MKMDRQLQLEMLRQLENVYPEAIDGVEDFDVETTDINIRLANVVYLKEHGLIKYKDASTMDGFDVHSIRVTKDGIDFMAADGGLSAILNVVVVELHADTIKALIAEKINHAELPPEQKQKYVDQLRQLPAESTKHLVNTLVEEGVKAGLRSGPQALQWLSTLFQNL